jgi:hypothetical protein
VKIEVCSIKVDGNPTDESAVERNIEKLGVGNSF